MTNTKDVIEKIVEEAIQKFGEHCHSIRIFVTYPSDDGKNETCGYTKGSGNIYAQIGQTKEFTVEQDEYVKVYVRNKVKD